MKSQLLHHKSENTNNKNGGRVNVFADSKQNKLFTMQLNLLYEAVCFSFFSNMSFRTILNFENCNDFDISYLYMKYKWIMYYAFKTKHLKLNTN